MPSCHHCHSHRRLLTSTTLTSPFPFILLIPFLVPHLLPPPPPCYSYLGTPSHKGYHRPGKSFPHPPASPCPAFLLLSHLTSHSELSTLPGGHVPHPILPLFPWQLWSGTPTLVLTSTHIGALCCLEMVPLFLKMTLVFRLEYTILVCLGTPAIIHILQK